MAQLIFPIILLTAGSYFLIRNISMIRNDEKLRKYLETSPKGKLWVNKIGLEKTMDRTKKIFLPLGIISAFAMLAYGSFAFWQIL